MDVTAGELIEQELYTMIERCSRPKNPAEGRDFWQEYVRAYDAAGGEDDHPTGCEYHQCQAEHQRRTLGPLVAFDEERATEPEDQGDGIR